MEADFLRSLHQTRQLEAELHDALAAVLKVGAKVDRLLALCMLARPAMLRSRLLKPHGNPCRCCVPVQGEGLHSAATFAKLQQRTAELQQRGAAATAKLEEQRQRVADVAAAAKASRQGRKRVPDWVAVKLRCTCSHVVASQPPCFLQPALLNLPGSCTPCRRPSVSAKPCRLSSRAPRPPAACRRCCSGSRWSRLWLR